jgi:hypothetical protein
MFAHEIVSDLSQIESRWLSVGHACRYSGISRAQLYKLLSQGIIKSASVRSSRGASRGIRIIDRVALDEYLIGLTNKNADQEKRPDKRPNPGRRSSWLTSSH